MKKVVTEKIRYLSIGVLAVLVMIVTLLASGIAEAVDPVSAYEVVVEHLMERTVGMTNGVEYLAIDTTQISNLNAAEKSDLLNRMQKYNLTVIESTRTDLESKGMIQNLYFPKGLLIIIETHKANRSSMTMDAQIWRGGAAGFGTKNLLMAYDHGQWLIVDSGGIFVA